MRKDEAWVVDILVACRHIQEFVAGVSREQFLADRKLQSALCMELEIIGEAARCVSETFKADHGQIPWSDIVALRHRIVHEYFRLDLDIIWQIVQSDVPELMRQVASLVPPESEE